MRRTSRPRRSAGTTTGIEAGQTVTLVVSDADPATPDVTVTAVMNPDGSYSTTADLSGLTDGPLSVTASVTDAAGNPATANDTASLDTSAGITVSWPTSMRPMPRPRRSVARRPASSRDGR